MVTEDDTRVIDPEFAFYGPMGFDVGVLVANFLMAFLSQPGHAVPVDDREAHGSYLLDQLTAIWTTFMAEFSALWRERQARADANLCDRRLDVDSPTFAAQALTSRLQQVWHDALGFAGCEIIRRVVGLAQVADFEGIADPDRRAECERRAVVLARALLLERAQCSDIAELTAMARAGQ